MPSYSPGAGWRRVTCQPLLALLLAAARGARGGTSRSPCATAVSIAFRTRTRAAGGELLVHVGGRGLGQGVGGLGDLAGLPRLHRQRLDEPPDAGEPVLEVEGVGDQLHPGQRGHAEGGGDRLGGERGDRRGALAAEGLVLMPSTPGRASPAQVATPVSAVAGCSTHHWAASRSLPRSAARASSLRCSSSARRPVGVEVLDHDRLSCCIGFEHVSIHAAATDSRAPERVGSGVLGKSKVKLSAGRSVVAALPRLRGSRHARWRSLLDQRCAPDHRRAGEPGSGRKPRRTSPRSCRGPQPPTSRRPPAGVSRRSALGASHLDQRWARPPLAASRERGRKPRRTSPRSCHHRNHPPPCVGCGGLDTLGAGAPRYLDQRWARATGSGGPGGGRKPRRTSPRSCHHRNHPRAAAAGWRRSTTLPAPRARRARASP